MAASIGSAGTSDAVVPAFRPDGSVDTSFGAGGTATLAAGGVEGARTLAVLPDGRIVVVAWAGTRAVVDRLTAIGSRDATWAVPGLTRAHALAVDPQGRIVVAGSTGNRAAVARLAPSGAPDASFGAGGSAGLGAASGDPSGLALQPDGKLVVASTVPAHTGDAAVFRVPANAPLRPPTVTLTRHPAHTLRSPLRRVRVTFAFRADTAGSTFRCALDAAAVMPCRAPVAYTIGRGRHRFRVEAVSAGRTGPAAAFGFTVLGAR